MPKKTGVPTLKQCLPRQARFSRNSTDHTVQSMPVSKTNSFKQSRLSGAKVTVASNRSESRSPHQKRPLAAVNKRPFSRQSAQSNSSCTSRNNRPGSRASSSLSCKSPVPELKLVKTQ